MSEGHAQALTFAIGDEWLALPASQVREVLKTPPVTRVPLSPQSLLGLANLRGTVLPVVSLAALTERDASAAAGRVIVFEGDGPVGLAVDQVAALVRADDSLAFMDVAPLLADQFGVRAKRPSAATFVAGAADVEAEPARVADAFLSFEVAGQEFALPLESVSEVLPMPDGISAIPQTDEAMVGVAPLRGALLPLLSMRHLLGFAPSAAGAPARVVAARLGGTAVGLVVDALKAIVRVFPEQVDPIPPVLTRGRQEAKIQSIARLDRGKRLVSILSTDHLLKDGLAERLAAEAQEEEIVAEQGAVATEQVLLFELGEALYALPIGCVDEIVPANQELTPLPNAPAFVAGVMTLRGRAVPVIDQAMRFGSARAASARAASARRPRIVVVRTGEGHAGFAVDGVSDVLRLPVADISPAPDMVRTRSQVIARVAQRPGDDRMILIVDPAVLLDEAERDLVAGLNPPR